MKQNVAQRDIFFNKVKNVNPQKESLLFIDYSFPKVISGWKYNTWISTIKIRDKIALSLTFQVHGCQLRSLYQLKRLETNQSPRMDTHQDINKTNGSMVSNHNINRAVDNQK